MHKKKEITVKELAGIIQATVTGDENYTVNNISEPESADERSIIYLSNKKYLEKIKSSKATAVLTSDNLVLESIKHKTFLIAEDLQESFIRLLEFFKYKEELEFKISKNASISRDVEIAERVHIDDNVIIKNNCKIGEDTVIHSSVYIGHDVLIGRNCIIFPNVTLYAGTVIGSNVIIHAGTVIGSAGFGYIQKDGKNIKIPQLGNVIIEDDVEIGSNTSIDCATIGSTIIKKGVKIDNMVMIAHNVIIGENSIIVSQTGISGSTTIGKNCILLGQVGVADHAVIEDNVIVGAKTGIPSRVVKSEEKMVFGTPAKTILKAKRIEAIVGKLPEIYQEFNELKKIIDEKVK